MTVAEMLNKVMVDVGVVGKTGFNEQQRFKFRGVDAVINAVGPALRKHGGFIVPDVIDSTVERVPSAKGGVLNTVRLLVRFNVYAVGSSESITGTVAAEAFDSGDKATAKAMSVAFRTFLIQLLCLPTDEPDPDEDTYAVAPSINAKTGEIVNWVERAQAVKTMDELKAVYALASKSGATEAELAAIKKVNV